MPCKNATKANSTFKLRSRRVQQCQRQLQNCDANQSLEAV